MHTFFHSFYLKLEISDRKSEAENKYPVSVDIYCHPRMLCSWSNTFVVWWGKKPCTKLLPVGSEVGPEWSESLSFETNPDHISCAGCVLIQCGICFSHHVREKTSSPKREMSACMQIVSSERNDAANMQSREASLATWSLSALPCGQNHLWSINNKLKAHWKYLACLFWRPEHFYV